MFFGGNIAYAKDYIAKSMEDGVDIIYNNPYHTLLFVAYREKELREMVGGLFAEIKKRNAEIEDINEQMLPTSGFYFRGIDGCLGVVCCEISMDKFEKNAQSLAMFTGWNYSVLSDVNARKPLSQKALTGLAMLGAVASGKV